MLGSKGPPIGNGPMTSRDPKGQDVTPIGLESSIAKTAGDAI